MLSFESIYILKSAGTQLTAQKNWKNYYNQDRKFLFF